MEISIVGFSSIVSRKVIPSLIKIKELKKINIFSRRNIEFNYKINNGIKVDCFNVGLLESFAKSNNNNIFYYISTENSTHFYFARILLNLKKNVLVDKPIVLDSDQLKILINLASLNKCFIGEVLNWEYHNQVKYIKEFIKRNNKFNVIARFTIPLPEEHSFRVNNKEGSGVFWDMNSYLYSTLRIFTKDNPRLYLSKNIGRFKPQWVKAYLKNSKFSFDGLYGFGFNYQNKLELESDKEIIIFDRIYTSEASSPLNVFLITNDSFNNYQITDDAFFNYFDKTIKSIINNDFSYSLEKIENQYSRILNSNHLLK